MTGNCSTWKVEVTSHAARFADRANVRDGSKADIRATILGRSPSRVKVWICGSDVAELLPKLVSTVAERAICL